MSMSVEAVVYIARKLGWNRETIGRLTPKQFNELLSELYFQESIDEYRRQHSIASLLAAIYNTIPRRRGSKAYQAKDFLAGVIPERPPQVSLTKLAEDKGIKLPTKELKQR